MKYCKFKSVDISKCINSGTTPKRGNPNETNEENELENELKMMNNEMQKQIPSGMSKKFFLLFFKNFLFLFLSQWYF